MRIEAYLLFSNLSAKPCLEFGTVIRTFIVLYNEFSVFRRSWYMWYLHMHKRCMNQA